MNYTDEKYQEAFNELYWLAQPPDVRALKDMPFGQERTGAAIKLAQEGHSIDVMIGVYGYTPWGAMSSRQMNGFKWAPALLQDLHVVQAPLYPWELGPGSTMPKGAILISLEGADYPAFDPPVVDPGVVLFPNPVGPCVWGNVYSGNFGDNWLVGGKFTDARGTFEKKSAPSMFGTKMWWEKV
jgi:hypothetical protein